MIHYGRQSITEEDIKAVADVLNSDFITQGPIAEQFGQELAQFCQAKHAVVASNGTAALHLACLSLGVTHGDLVWVSAISFVSSANCAKFCGADVEFIDIDPETGLLCLDDLESKLDQAKQSNSLPKAVIAVHLAGQSCDMQKLYELCSPLGIYIIEDACHALGSTYKSKPVGSCLYSDCAVFSFHPVKPITSGEGGALLTNQSELAHKASLFANNGVTKKQDEYIQVPDGPWYYEMQVLGYNYRLTDIQAALGLSQLKRIEAFTAKRNTIAKLYDQLFASYDIPFTPLKKAFPEDLSAYHLYVIKCQASGLQKATFEALYRKGFGCQVHYIPIFLHPYYKNHGSPESFPGAMQYYSSAFSIPIYADLDEDAPSQFMDALVSSLAENASL